MNTKQLRKMIIKAAHVIVLDHLSDKMYVKFMFRDKIGYSLDLDNPRTFNEKLNWLKLYNQRPEYTVMVDKYAAKKYIADHVGEEFVIPTIGIYDSFEEIDFAKLPSQFVMKTTHDSGGVVICKDKSKFDVKAARKKIEASLKNNYFFQGREWPYKHVPHRIIIEDFLSEPGKEVIDNWKLYCSYGRLFTFYVTTGGGHSNSLEMTYFDLDNKPLPVKNILYPNVTGKVVIPEKMEEMKKIAELLSADHPFLRVDFYYVNNRIYVGELTLFPGCGFEVIQPREYDELWGNDIQLPNKKIRQAE